MQFFTMDKNVVLNKKKGRIWYCAELVVNYAIEACFTDKSTLEGVQGSAKGTVLKERRNIGQELCKLSLKMPRLAASLLTQNVA